MKTAPLLLLVAAALPLGACEKAMRNMYEQPKYDSFDGSSLWADGRSVRPLQPGVVVRSAGVLAETSSGRRSEVPPPPPESIVYPRSENGSPLVAAPAIDTDAALRNPLPPTLANLQRGRERYDIYCAPCHSVVGDGDGMVVRRGFPAPATLHSDKLRAAPDGYLFDVIGRGYGAMYPFADRIRVGDRWAIVDYMRALQLSRHARLDDLPAADRAAVTKAEP
jgi:mono/diheme cytochrome c family protein